MSELSLVDSDPFKKMEEVATAMMKGHSELKVARDLGIKVIEVRSIWGEFKERLNQDSFANDAARDHLNLMVKQYDDSIAKLHENLEALEFLEFNEKISAQINATVKNIADMLAKRVDLLQKAGLMDAHDLGTELAEREEREEAIIKILREDLCPDCRMTVARKLQALTNMVEATVVYDD